VAMPSHVLIFGETELVDCLVNRNYLFVDRGRDRHTPVIRARCPTAHAHVPVAGTRSFGRFSHTIDCHAATQCQ